MSLVLNEDQKMLQDAAKNFCQQNAAISNLRRLRDEGDATGFDSNIWQQMIDLGWAGMAIPEAYGGFEFGYAGLGVVLEQTGRTLVSSPLIPTVLLGATALLKLGSEEQKQELLPKIVSGELLLGLALDELPIHKPQYIATTAKAQDGKYIINGSKTFVLDGNVADKLLVVVRTSGATSENDGVSLLLVDRDSEGVDVQRTTMVDSRNSAKITFNDVEVSADALLGELGGSAADLDYVLDIARIGLAAEMLGSVQEVFERIVEFLGQREQFGVLIGSFQALQHRAAIMYSEIELCKSVVRAALSAADNSASDPVAIAKMASLSQAKLCEVTELVSNEGVQMHGGIGMTDEFDIGFFLKRARVAQQFLGDSTFHRDRYATLNDF